MSATAAAAVAAAPSTDDTPNHIVLYEDRFVRLTDDALVIKWYYFPTGKSKTIPRKDIDRMWVGTDPELDLTWYRKKTWGIALSDVFWACHWFREFNPNNNEAQFVVAVVQPPETNTMTKVRPGFSVEDPGVFRALVDEYIPKQETQDEVEAVAVADDPTSK
eukprot:jgi/Psemu1/302230/fgenesh1_kg.62_\